MVLDSGLNSSDFDKLEGGRRYLGRIGREARVEETDLV